MNAEIWSVVLVGFGLLVSLLGYLELSRRATAKSTDRKFDKLDATTQALGDKIDDKTDSLRKEIKEDLKSLREDLAQTNQNLYDLNTRVSAALGLPAAEPADSSA